MADTGAPWNIPYVEPTDLVREYPAADEAQANAIAAGLSAAGGLVAVKSAAITVTFASAVAADAVVTPTGLLINHAVADASNKVILIANVYGGWAANAANDFMFRFHAGATAIGIGDADGARLRVSGADQSQGANTLSNVNGNVVHVPGTTDSIEYSVRVGHFATSTQTVYVNRANGDADTATIMRPHTSLLLMEVRP